MKENSRIVANAELDGGNCLHRDSSKSKDDWPRDDRRVQPVRHEAIDEGKNHKCCEERHGRFVITHAEAQSDQLVLSRLVPIMARKTLR